ncbi:MAG: hypothetical protein PWQ52_899 [Methanolobus sp.]|jgi:hypothetical protein|nr:hypothetical protein [Methanolobus sp.]
MVSFFIGFDFSGIIIEIIALVLLILLVKRYERIKGKKISLFSWLQFVVAYFIILRILFL